MKVYFISGLAADSRVFRNLRLPEGFEPVYLDWIKPVPSETLSQYAERLAEPINPQNPFALLGVSMGGMIATEIGHKISPKTTVLVSSVPVAAGLPPWFRMAGAVRLQKIVPVSLVKSVSLLKRFFSAETEEDKKILRQVIHDSDPGFIRWAMDAILQWENKVPPLRYIHIHGSRDELLPMRFTRPTHIIQGAGHLMVMNRANDINRILGEELTKVSWQES